MLSRILSNNVILAARRINYITITVSNESIIAMFNSVILIKLMSNNYSHNLIFF